MKTIPPPKLDQGDLIGIVSPASPLADPARIEKGVRYLESLGYRTVVGAHAAKANGYLAGTDEERVADLHTMFADKNVKAIMCVRGGYGTPRLLSLLDYTLITRNPKIVVGFSDITALQLALLKKCRLITFHGPMAGVEMANAIDPFTEEFFWRCVTSRRKIGRIALPRNAMVETLNAGTATGRLIGGNLSLIVTLIGTQYLPDFSDALLCIEETTEEPYRVDRMLTQIRNASLFTKARGVLLGQFTECLPRDPAASFSVEQVLNSFTRQFGKPALANLPFGHTPQKMTLPIGLHARVDATKAHIEFLEPAVR